MLYSRPRIRGSPRRRFAPKGGSVEFRNNISEAADNVRFGSHDVHVEFEFAIWGAQMGIVVAPTTHGERMIAPAERDFRSVGAIMRWYGRLFLKRLDV